jgi:hypothetical protein
MLSPTARRTTDKDEYQEAKEVADDTFEVDLYGA